MMKCINFNSQKENQRTPTEYSEIVFTGENNMDVYDAFHAT